MSGGGSSGPSSTDSTVTQYSSNLPEWAEPWYNDLMGRGITESAIPYSPYPGQRLAYFSPQEQEAMARMGELGVSGTSPEMDTAGQIAYGVGITAPGYDYMAGTPWNANYEAGGMDFGYLPSARLPSYSPENYDWEAARYNPGSRESSYVASDYDPTGSYTANQRDVGFQPGTLTDSQMIGQYMDPYYQNVVDIEKREASRQADMRNANIGLNAAGSGSLGGYREAIMQAENERNLAQQMGDIQTRGSQSAWQSGVQNFEADRAARAQLEQFGQGQFGLNEQARQRQAELMQQGYSVQEAARQAQEEFGQSQFGMNQQVQQRASELMQQGYTLHDAMQQAQEQFSQGQYGLNQNAMQTREQLYQNMYGLTEGQRLAQAQQGLQAYNAYEQARQSQAQIGMQQQQNQLASAAMMGDFAAQRQLMEIERLNQMLRAGGMERDFYQSAYDIGYQDFLRQQSYPREQLGLYSNMLYGLPVSPGGYQQTYGPQSSQGQQLLGSGIAGLGLYSALGKGGGN